jgi:hypothetical protein
MVQRGRKSAAASNVVVIDAAQIKPAPPKHLTAGQTEIWKITVDAMKAGAFPAATHPLLETYCMRVSRGALHREGAARDRSEDRFQALQAIVEHAGSFECNDRHAGHTATDLAEE